MLNNEFSNSGNIFCQREIRKVNIPYMSLGLSDKYNMITTRTAALIAAMSLLGTIAPAAFVQVGNINEDDDIFAQIN